MNREIRKSIAGLALALLAFGATANTMTFDDVTTGGDAPIVNGYGGLDWDNFLAITTLAPSGFVNGRVSGLYVATNSGGGTAAFSADAPFTFNSAFITAAWRDNLTVDITGSLNGVQTNFSSLSVLTSGPTLATLNWSNIDMVSFSSYGGTQHPGYVGTSTHFVMDNLTISPVPEAETYAMLLAGLGIVGVMARRRRAGERQ